VELALITEQTVVNRKTAIGGGLVALIRRVLLLLHQPPVTNT
jgi:hypothetical protein